MVEFGIYQYVLVYAGIFVYKHPCTFSRLFILLYPVYLNTGTLYPVYLNKTVHGSLKA